MQVKVSKHEQKLRLHYKHDFVQYHDRDRINLLFYVYVWRVVEAINSSFNDTQIENGRGKIAFNAFVEKF